MKLITKSSLTFISASVIFFLIGSIIMYFSVRNIVSANLNSILTEKKEEIILQSKFNELTNYKSKNININICQNVFEENYSDTVLIENEKYVLYRKLDFLLTQNNKNYKVSILEPQKRTDLLIIKLVIMILGLAFLFFLILFFVNRHSIKSTLKVFYKTIQKLEKFDINSNKDFKLDTASTFEIKKMNSVIQKMADSLKRDFESQREYIENVSHELQTPLAIINSKLDELIQSENLSQIQIEKLAVILESTNRLSKINQALIFLTKIDNRLFSAESKFCLNNLVTEQLEMYKDVINEKEINLKTNFTQNLNITMHKQLAETMISNLIRNSIIYNNEQKKVNIFIKNDSLIISNTGEKLTFPENKIFDRFKKSNLSNRSLGIGLSVVKSICNLYTFDIKYRHNKMHTFTIKFSKNERFK
mgnify:FL=1